MTAAALALLLARAAAASPLPDALDAHQDAARRTVEKRTVGGVVGPTETPLSFAASEFLLDHPDLSAWLVRRRKIAPYVIEMRGPGRSWADDGDGTTGFIDLVYRSPEKRVYYTEGTHVSALFPDVRASAVIVLDMKPVPREGCREHVESSFDVSVKLRSGFLSTMVKVLKPFIRGLIVRKFSRAFAVADQVGVLLAKDPAGVGAEMLAFPGLSDAERESLKALSSLPPEREECLAARSSRVEPTPGSSGPAARP